jgi:polar amino acid transport system substrate-binding protein
MKTVNVILAAFVITIWSAQSMAGEKTVSLAVLNWEPYAGEKLKNFGFGVEIITEAFRRSGYTAIISFMPWIRALKDTEIGKYDAVGFAYYSDQRARTYTMSGPFSESSLEFCRHKDSSISYKTLQDLKSYRIGIVRGYVNTAEFDAANYLTKEETNSEMLNLKKLLNKRVDLILIDKYVARFLIAKNFHNEQSEFVLIEPPLKIQPLYLMFSKKIKNHDLMCKDFNRGLQQISDDGTINKIMASHGFD